MACWWGKWKGPGKPREVIWSWTVDVTADLGMDLNAVSVRHRKSNGLQRPSGSVTSFWTVGGAGVDGEHASVWVRRWASGMKDDRKETLGSAVDGNNLVAPRTL